MAKKKKGGGTRTVSRQEREAWMQKAEKPFGPVRYMKENLYRIMMAVVIMMALCMIAEQIMPGDYLVPGVVAFLLVEGFQYYRAYRADRKKTAAK